MTPPIRMLVSDVDGTLVRPDKSLADATVSAFGRLRKAGIAATLISARPPSGMLHLAEALGIENPLGAFNGGTIFATVGGTHSRECLEPDVVRTALELTHDLSVDIWLFADERWYARSANNPRVPRERLSAQVEPILVAELADFAANVDKIVFVSENSAALQRVEQASRLALGTSATIVRSQPYFLDITAPAANKGDGLEALTRKIGVSLNETAVIGDMPNDLPMFARAGLSIAMGQAPDNVRAAADRVTASDADDGVAAAIDRLISEHVWTAS